MKWNAKLIRELIKKERNWHQGEGGKSGKSDDFERGFLTGLDHILDLIRTPAR